MEGTTGRSLCEWKVCPASGQNTPGKTSVAGRGKEMFAKNVAGPKYSNREIVARVQLRRIPAISSPGFLAQIGQIQVTTTGNSTNSKILKDVIWRTNRLPGAVSNVMNLEWCGIERRRTGQACNTFPGLQGPFRTS